MYIYPSGARLKIRWSGRKWDRCEILDDRWEETAKEEKRRRTTVDRAVRELAESFRIRIGEKGGLKVGRVVRRLTKHAIPSKQICIVLCDVLPQLQRPRLASVRHGDTRNKQLIKCNFISGTRVRAHTSLSLFLSLQKFRREFIFVPHLKA